MGGLFSTALHSTPLLTSPEWPDSRCAVSRRSQVPDGGDGGGEPEGLGGRRTGGERGALRESSGGVARFVCGLWREGAGESASVERGGRVRHDTTTSFRDSARLPTP